MAGFRLLLMLILALLVAPAAGRADGVGDFYKGRTVNLMIGLGVGDAADVWARMIARHMGSHLPGNPTIVPQNLPGSGSLLLMNQLANTLPRDGSVFGVVNRGIPFEPLLGGKGTQFDPKRLSWIGSPDKDTSVCGARKDASVQSMADLRRTELVVGATGSGADTEVYPAVLGSLLGMKFKVVRGYPGSHEIALAMERGEVQGLCLAYESMARMTLFREGKMNVLLQASMTPDPRLQQIPAALDAAQSQEDRQALQLFFARNAIGRPFLAGPDVPAERLAALRQAFAATLKDPDFVAEAKKASLSIYPISGEEIASVIDAAYESPPAVVKRTMQALGRE